MEAAKERTMDRRLERLNMRSTERRRDIVNRFVSLAWSVRLSSHCPKFCRRLRATTPQFTHLAHNTSNIPETGSGVHTITYKEGEFPDMQTTTCV